MEKQYLNSSNLLEFSGIFPACFDHTHIMSVRALPRFLTDLSLIGRISPSFLNLFIYTLIFIASLQTEEMRKSGDNSKKKSSLTQTLLSGVEHTKNKRLAEKEKTSKKVKLSKKDKENDIDYQESKLKSDILRFNTEGYVVINQDDLEKDIIDLSLSAGTNIRRTWISNPLRVYFSINSMHIFDELLRSVNEEAIRLTTTNEVAESSKKYYSGKHKLCDPWSKIIVFVLENSHMLLLC